jgi:chemotaxis protein CheY-P-specific phosphatase CheC
MKQNIREILKISIQNAISSMGILNDKNINIFLHEMTLIVHLLIYFIYGKKIFFS